jgi:hypothetical protein
MWNYLTPFHVIYEPARRYEIPERFRIILDAPYILCIDTWAKCRIENWDCGIVDHLNA